MSALPSRLPFTTLIALAALSGLRRDERIESHDFHARYVAFAQERGFDSKPPGCLWTFVDGLRKKGLVTRTTGKRGRHGVYYIAATAKGMDLLESARKVLE